MATQEQADLALTFYQNKLFENPNLSYLSVVESDSSGDRYHLEAGVISMSVQAEAERGRLTRDGIPFDEAVPRQLLIPQDSAGASFLDEAIEVVVVESGEILVQVFTDRRRPCECGNSIGNPNLGGAGSIGALTPIRGDVQNRYFITNWHVVVGAQGQQNDPIVQPGPLDGGTVAGDRIGQLLWFALTDLVDAAMGRFDDPNEAVLGWRCGGRNNGWTSPWVGMRVRKCGRTTELTNGTIRSVNASVRVNGYPGGPRLFREQIQTENMSDPGDSGSCLTDQQFQIVGLTFAGGPTASFHNNWFNVIATLAQQRQETLPSGETIVLGPIELDMEFNG